MSANPSQSPQQELDNALVELARYRRGFENLERHIKVLDRERQKLGVVLNHAPVGFIILDRELQVTWTNPKLAAELDPHAGEVAGRACHEVLCREDGPCAGCPARRALHDPAPCHVELATNERDGTTRRWYVSAAQIRSPQGEFEEILAMIQDLTDLEILRRSEASLSGQKRVLEMIASGGSIGDVLGAICRQVESEAPDTVCTINVFDEASQTLKPGAAPSLPPGYLDLVQSLPVSTCAAASGTEAFRGQRVVCEDIANDPAWESARDIAATHGLRSCWSKPVLGSSDRLLGAFALYFCGSRTPSVLHETRIDSYAHLVRIAIERNLSDNERSKLEGQLRQSQKLEAIGTLAGGVAHDFNNLMTGVLGYVSLLRHNPNDSERVLKAATVIENAARRAADLTSNLLGFARKGRYQSTPVEMNGALEEVAALLGRTIDKRIELMVERWHEDVWIQADPAQVHQVLLNLTVNARDAMPEGGRLTMFTRVEARPEDGGEVVVIGVADTGVGIPEEIGGRVFEPFFTTKSVGRGSGMGLATAYGIVRNHGGELRFDSEVGNGTTFHFRLPRIAPESVHVAPPEPLSDLPMAGASIAAAEIASAMPRRRPPRVLVVDDEESVREVCSDILHGLGYDVIRAQDGVRGLEIFRRDHASIDLVVLDMIMPRMSGRDCFREMKALNPGVRVVLATGYARDGAAQQMLDEGVLGFLQKPYEMRQLAGAVSAALRRNS